MSDNFLIILYYTASPLIRISLQVKNQLSGKEQPQPTLRPPNQVDIIQAATNVALSAAKPASQAMIEAQQKTLAALVNIFSTNKMFSDA